MMIYQNIVYIHLNLYYFGDEYNTKKKVSFKIIIIILYVYFLFLFVKIKCHRMLCHPSSSDTLMSRGCFIRYITFGFNESIYNVILWNVISKQQDRRLRYYHHLRLYLFYVYRCTRIADHTSLNVGASHSRSPYDYNAVRFNSISGFISTFEFSTNCGI